MSEVVVPSKGDHIYEVSYFDETGAEMGESDVKELRLMEVGVERELQFMCRALCYGAHSYSVRVLRPGEVKSMIRQHKKAEAQRRRDELTRSALSTIGLDMDNLTPVIINMQKAGSTTIGY